MTTTRTPTPSSPPRRRAGEPRSQDRQGLIAQAKRKLTARDTRAIAEAENKVAKAEAALELAKEDRARVRAKYLPRIPLSDDAEERGKGIRKVAAGAYRIRVTPVTGRDSFSLKRYVDLGHRITTKMREAMKTGDPYERWTVTPVKGPAKPGAVEPT